MIVCMMTKRCASVTDENGGSGGLDTGLHSARAHGLRTRKSLDEQTSWAKHQVGRGLYMYDTEGAPPPPSKKGPLITYVVRYIISTFPYKAPIFDC